MYPAGCRMERCEGDKCSKVRASCSSKLHMLSQIYVKAVNIQSNFVHIVHVFLQMLHIKVLFGPILKELDSSSRTHGYLRGGSRA